MKTVTVVIVSGAPIWGFPTLEGAISFIKDGWKQKANFDRLEEITIPNGITQIKVFLKDNQLCSTYEIYTINVMPE